MLECSAYIVEMVRLFFTLKCICCYNFTDIVDSILQWIKCKHMWFCYTHNIREDVWYLPVIDCTYISLN